VFGELDGVPEEVGEDLLDADRVAVDGGVVEAADVEGDAEALGLRDQAHLRHDAPRHALQVELHHLNLQLPGLDLVQVKHVVHDPHQLRAALLRVLDQLTLLLRNGRVLQKRDVPQHAVERVPHFVAQKAKVRVGCFLAPS